MKAENWCYGVGMYVDGSDIELHEVKVTGNISGDNAIWYYGNGIYMNETTADLFNVLVAENRSGTGGSFNYGGGIYCDGAGSNVFMMNCTLTGNTKTNNGTITGSGLYSRDAVVTAVNTIFYNPNNGLEFTSNGVASFGALWSNIRGGGPGGGIGCIDTIPGFVSLSDFHLLPTSPCAGVGTDNGAPFIDLDGIPRPLPAFTWTDMGCYEVDQSVTGLAEVTIAEFSAYPNPVKSGEVLTVMNAGKKIIVTDITGRIVFESENNSSEFGISTQNWKSGYYLLRSENSKALKICVMD